MPLSKESTFRCEGKIRSISTKIDANGGLRPNYKFQKRSNDAYIIGGLKWLIDIMGMERFVYNAQDNRYAQFFLEALDRMDNNPMLCIEDVNMKYTFLSDIKVKAMAVKKIIETEHSQNNNLKSFMNVS